MKYRTQKNAEATARYWNKPLDRPDWFKVEAREDGSTEIFVYDVIGWPFVDSYELVREISHLSGKDITVRINSPGGDVFDGFALFNALSSHDGKVTTINEGFAASMASVIYLAGDTRKSYKNAMVMIHEPWSCACGDQHMFRDVAELLGKMSSNLLDVYFEKSALGKRELRQMMKDETWFTASEAKEKGFITEVIDKESGKAEFDLSMFANVPENVLNQPQGRELNEREIERALRDAGASRTFAKSIVASKYKALRDAELDETVKQLIKTLQG